MLVVRVFSNSLCDNYLRINFSTMMLVLNVISGEISFAMNFIIDSMYLSITLSLAKWVLVSPPLSCI